MATITGKRFQITDGASTPTNLFPYTVSEAVYGLSNTISNAISTALSALSLSTYAGTSAIGSSTQPVYYNGSALVATDLSTTYAPYNSAGYLPLTGGTITGIYGALSIKRSNAYGSSIKFENKSKVLGYLGIDYNEKPMYVNSDASSTYYFWHSGNSNLSTVDWACKSLSATGAGKFGQSAEGVIISKNGNTIDGFSWDYTTSKNLHINYSSTGNVTLCCGGGNAGVGILSPKAKLHIHGASGEMLRLSQTVNYTAGAGPKITFYNDVSEQLAAITGAFDRASGQYANLYFGTRTSDALGVETKMTILYNGNVGIGTTSPTQKLHVAGNILSTGAITAGATSSSSDARLKSNIKDFAYTPSLLLALKPREWDWNEYSHLEGHSAGIVAQEIQKLMPYAVGSVSDEKFGEHLTMNYDTLHALEIAGLQDHESRIRQLEAENRELRKQLNMN